MRPQDWNMVRLIVFIMLGAAMGAAYAYQKDILWGAVVVLYLIMLILLGSSIIGEEPRPATVVAEEEPHQNRTLIAYAYVAKGNTAIGKMRATINRADFSVLSPVDAVDTIGAQFHSITPERASAFYRTFLDNVPEEAEIFSGGDVTVCVCVRCGRFVAQAASGKVPVCLNPRCYTSNVQTTSLQPPILFSANTGTILNKVVFKIFDDEKQANEIKRLIGQYVSPL